MLMNGGQSGGHVNHLQSGGPAVLNNTGVAEAFDQSANCCFEIRSLNINGDTTQHTLHPNGGGGGGESFFCSSFNGSFSDFDVPLSPFTYAPPPPPSPAYAFQPTPCTTTAPPFNWGGHYNQQMAPVAQSVVPTNFLIPSYPNGHHSISRPNSPVAQTQVVNGYGGGVMSDIMCDQSEAGYLRSLELTGHANFAVPPPPTSRQFCCSDGFVQQQQSSETLEGSAGPFFCSSANGVNYGAATNTRMTPMLAIRPSTTTFVPLPTRNWVPPPENWSPTLAPHPKIPRNFYQPTYRGMLRSNLTLDEIVRSGSVQYMAVDRDGCRVLQDLLKTEWFESPQLVERVFSQLLANFDELLVNNTSSTQSMFAMYCFQMFVKLGNERHAIRMGEHMRKKVVSMAVNKYPCILLQETMNKIGDKQMKLELISELASYVRSCVAGQTAQSGNHLIQNILSFYAPHEFDFIVKEIVQSLSFVSKDKYGCRVLQTVIDKANEQQKYMVFETVLKGMNEYVCHQYANYVLQHVVEFGTEDVRRRVVENIRGKVVAYAQNKFGSHVIERCLLFCNKQLRDSLLDEILGTTPLSSPSTSPMSAATLFSPIGYSKSPRKPIPAAFDKLLVHNFGNYVAQRMLEVADEWRHLRPMLATVGLRKAQLLPLSSGKFIVEKARIKAEQVEKMAKRGAVDANNNRNTAVAGSPKVCCSRAVGAERTPSQASSSAHSTPSPTVIIRAFGSGETPRRLASRRLALDTSPP